jgi:ATP-binding cassette subfamily B protein
VLSANAQFSLLTLSIGIIFVHIMKVVVTALQKMIVLHCSYNIDIRLIPSCFSHIVKLPFSFFDEKSEGDIIARIDDAQKIKNSLTDLVLTFFADLLMMLIIIPLLFFTNSTLCLIMFLVIPLNLVLIGVFSFSYNEVFKQIMSRHARLKSHLFESLKNIFTIKAMSVEENVASEFQSRFCEMMQSDWKHQEITITQTALSNIVMNVCNALVFWIGSKYIINNELSVGALISFTMLVGFLIEPATRLINLQGNVQEAIVAAKRLYEILQVKEENESADVLQSPAKFDGNIVLNNMSFSYVSNTNKKIYDHISLQIHKGDFVAFIGHSGCGKTTLVKLLLRFYEPTDGEIFIDDYNSKELDVQNLRIHAGYIPQEISLFSGTVLENITMYHAVQNMENVINAARLSGAHNFISKMPDKYYSQLSEGGTNLSGEEKQRIALARALYNKPDFLILDEITNNLDIFSENKINETIQNLRKSGMTIMMIAHKLSNIKSCDCIYVIDAGRIIQSGKHRDLLKCDGLYKDLWIQSGGEINE